MAKRPIYFGKLMAELAMQAEHGHFRDAKNYSEDTGVYMDDRTRRLIFTISINGIRFDYDTVKESHTFFRLNGRCLGDYIREGWDGLSSSQQDAFVGELYGFLRINGLTEMTFREFFDFATDPPADLASRVRGFL